VDELDNAPKGPGCRDAGWPSPSSCSTPRKTAGRVAGCELVALIRAG
jgi:hypothetical protein